MSWNNQPDLAELLSRLRNLPAETETVEFKENNSDPEMIARTVVALANAAALEQTPVAFMVWGVRDSDHKIVGTTFDPYSLKKGNEDFISWLTRSVNPQISLDLGSAEIDGQKVIILRIPAAEGSPRRYKKVSYIRIGSYTKELADYPSHERRLWGALAQQSVETQYALTDLLVEEIVDLLDYPSYFRLHRQPLPEHRSQIIETFIADNILADTTEHGLCIYNSGALLYASDLSKFSSLSRKAPRVIIYDGLDRVHARKEQIGVKGYAAGFQGLVAYIGNALPSAELISQSGVREDGTLIPPIVVRELVANILIHQDLTMKGTGPKVEIFDDRVEFTNPGEPLVDPLRFIDSPPRSRNEQIGAGFRKVKLAEERGSGWDRIASELDIHQLPPARVEVLNSQTHVTISGPKPLNKMRKDEISIAVYQHACLRHVSQLDTNNASIRKRFGIAEKNKARASRILGDAVQAGLIAPYDENAGPRNMRYVPFWAKTTESSVFST